VAKADADRKGRESGSLTPALFRCPSAFAAHHGRDAAAVPEQSLAPVRTNHEVPARWSVGGP